ncbi:hypothetical protein KUTeg_020699 [Tegillarca granosa]|uniref:Uncharacterized protein n=1 Tax=Tegillarca granosa TaxID=220873 RepID=A0ABQ9ECX2_TEGGR|nr:hypothetical protein KUTeg_020699 [Tegillarca granosa]
MNFQHSRDVLTAKRIHLKTHGKGNRRHRADELTLEDIESLYQSENLGTENSRCPVAAYKVYVKHRPDG